MFIFVCSDGEYPKYFLKEREKTYGFAYASVLETNATLIPFSNIFNADNILPRNINFA